MEQVSLAVQVPVPEVGKAGGGHRWLAVTPTGSTPVIGVFGNSKEDARSHFADRFRRWTEFASSVEP